MNDFKRSRQGVYPRGISPTESVLHGTPHGVSLTPSERLSILGRQHRARGEPRSTPTDAVRAIARCQGGESYRALCKRRAIYDPKDK